MAGKESKHDTGRKVGSVAMSALMVWSMAPHPVIAQTATGSAAEDGDGQTPQEALEQNPAQQEAEVVTAENDGSDAAADEAAAEETQEALGEKLDAAAPAPADGAAGAASETDADADADAGAQKSTANAAAAAATTAQNVPYVDGSGTLKQVTSATLLSSALASSATLPTGWYLVDTDITQAQRIVASGDVHLILGDGKTLTAQGGITVPSGSTLTVYGQTAQTGALVAKAPAPGAAIGGVSGVACGDIVIDGGTITATSTSGPGIGAVSGAAGTVAVNGGSVTSTGIGGAGPTDGVTAVTINGGTVTSTAKSGPGISAVSSTGKVTINGGTVTAKAGDTNSAGIGGFGTGDAPGVSIAGGTVKATGGSFSAGIGSGSMGSGSGAGNCNAISITGGNVTAIGGSNGGAAIGGGRGNRDGGTILISGPNTVVKATANGYSGAIGGGRSGHCGNVTISNGARVTAQSATEAIGAGDGGAATGSITINGAYVLCTTAGDQTVPGIGACGNTASGPSIPVTITGNSVVFVEGPINENDKANWNGLIGQARDANGNPSRRGIRTAKLYGTTVEPAFAFEIPSGFTLDIEAGKTLGVHNGVSMNNLGTVNVSGTLDYTGGKLYNSGTITKVGQGQIIPDDSIVTVAPAAIAMAAQSGSPVYGDNIALQATVTGANGSGGTVEFFVNGTPAGTATPDSSGVASLSSQAVTPLWHGGANSVYAVFSGGTGQASAKSDAVTYNVAKKPLAAPANVAWTTGSGNATVSWNAVDHATYYTVQLLKDGQAQGLPLYVYNTTGAASVNWTFPLTAAGSYTAQVTAVGDTNYANAQATTAVAVNTVSFNAGVAGSGASGMPSLQGVLAGGTYTRPGDPTCTGYVFSHWTAPDGGNPFASGNTTTVGSPLLLTANWGLEAMTGVRWGGQTQAAWNAVPNAHDYLVTLYDNSGAAPVAVGTASNVLPPNPATPTVTYDFSNMTAPGTYSFSVQALGDTGVTGNAPVSSPVVSSVTFDMNGAHLDGHSRPLRAARLRGGRRCRPYAHRLHVLGLDWQRHHHACHGHLRPDRERPAGLHRQLADEHGAERGLGHRGGRRHKRHGHLGRLGRRRLRLLGAALQVCERRRGRGRGPARLCVRRHRRQRGRAHHARGGCRLYLHRDAYRHRCRHGQCLRPEQ